MSTRENIRLIARASLSEGVLSNTGKILDTVDQSKLLLISHGNSPIQRKTSTQEQIFKKNLHAKILVSFQPYKAKIYRFHHKL